MGSNAGSKSVKISVSFCKYSGRYCTTSKYGSDTSRHEYDRIIAEFVANGRQAFYHPDEILIESLIAQYIHYIRTEVDYSKNTRERINRTFRLLNECYGKQPASAFGPTALKSLWQRKERNAQKKQKRKESNDWT